MNVVCDEQLERLAADLDAAAQRSGAEWWTDEQWRKDAVRTGADALIAVLGEIGAALRAGTDPAAITGGYTARAAAVTAGEWVEAGVPAGDVGRWLAAGCWRAASAREMSDAGLVASQLVDADGWPKHLSGSLPSCPVASAVADGRLSVAEAVALLGGPSVAAGQ